MRVHGDKKITRRTGVTPYTKYNYREAKLILQEDFQDLCGYCGKNRKVFRERFQIDHFVPKSLSEDRIGDYYNFVLACPKCNLMKSDKWPTRDINKANDGIHGFIDPVDCKFDEHLYRNDNGFVEGKTDLGNNICSYLHLDIRRTDLHWKIQLLSEIKNNMKDLHIKNLLTSVQKDFYILIDTNLQEMLDYIYNIGD